MEDPDFAFVSCITLYAGQISMFMQGRMQSFETSQKFQSFLQSLSHLPAVLRHLMTIDFSNVAPQRHLPGSWLEHLCIANEQTTFHTRPCTLI